MKAIILIKIQAGEVHTAYDFLRRLEGISDIYMTFGPYDAVACVEAPDLTEIGRVVAGHIQPIPGVISTLTLLTFENAAEQKEEKGLFRKRVFQRN